MQVSTMFRVKFAPRNQIYLIETTTLPSLDRRRPKNITQFKQACDINLISYNRIHTVLKKVHRIRQKEANKHTLRYLMINAIDKLRS